MKRKLLLAALCVVGALGMRAQSWTASEVAAGDFYLYNVGAGKFLGAGNNWGTRASVLENGALKVTLIGSESTYKISTDSEYQGKQLGSNGYVDNGDADVSWTFTEVSTGVYTLSCSAGYLVRDANATTTSFVADAPTTENGYWKLATKDNLVAVATAESPVDATFLITTPNFDRNAGGRG